MKQAGHDAGFDLVGVTDVSPSQTAEYYRQWLAAGYGGTMAYLARHVPMRREPSRLLPGARSIICVALSCHRLPNDGVSGLTSAHPPQPGDTPTLGGISNLRSQISNPGVPAGDIAMYARGRDYHVVIGRMLEALAGLLRDRLGEAFEWRPCVDAAPILERELAARAGLGWIGRNTCLVHPTLGSHLLLGELLTTLDLAPDKPLPNGCGHCRRCVNACPTAALLPPPATAEGAAASEHCSPGGTSECGTALEQCLPTWRRRDGTSTRAPTTLDARRCISYLTIEHRDAIDPDLARRMGTWVFGCDACQNVCPYNRRAPAGTNAHLLADLVPARLALADLTQLRAGSWRRLTRDSATRRARPAMWRRNAEIAQSNAAQ
ncbi:MAG: DUF1730 domain-containing protein [Phycisphaerae bacterium]